MKICFLTIKDPEDKRSWSGIFYHLYSNLKQFHEVEWIGNVKFHPFQKFLLKIEYYYYKLVKHRSLSHNTLFSIFYAKNVKHKLKKSDFDLIFAPASSELIAFLDVKIPIVYLSDTTFQLMIDYYPDFNGLTKKRIKEGNLIEGNAIKHASKVIFSSNWAKNSAVNFYHGSPEKISVFELGANLLYEPQREDLDFSDSEVCNILFLGVDWIRKGGDTAYKTYLKLKEKGLPCTFTIIGCNPKIDLEDNNLLVIPFLNKNEKNDFDRLLELCFQKQVLLEYRR
jgi:hypothetical protein